MTSGLSSGGPAPLPLGPQAWEGAHRLAGVQGLRRKSPGLEGREAEADPLLLSCWPGTKAFC